MQSTAVRSSCNGRSIVFNHEPQSAPTVRDPSRANLILKPRFKFRSFPSSQSPSPSTFRHPITVSRCLLPSKAPGCPPFVNSASKVGTDVWPLHCGVSTNTFDGSEGRSFRDWVELVGEVISTAFPIWVALGCLLGLVKPSCYDWVKPKWTVLGLAVTMLGMGMTLSFDDLRGALAMPKELISGFVLQYSVCSALISSHSEI